MYKIFFVVIHMVPSVVIAYANALPFEQVTSLQRFVPFGLYLLAYILVWGICDRMIEPRRLTLPLAIAGAVVACISASVTFSVVRHNVTLLVLASLCAPLGIALYLLLRRELIPQPGMISPE